MHFCLRCAGICSGKNCKGDHCTLLEVYKTWVWILSVALYGGLGSFFFYVLSLLGLDRTKWG